MARKESTNLILCEDGQEYVGNPTTGTPGTDEQYGANSVQGTRLDEHGDDGPIDSSRSGTSAEGISNVPAVQDESEDDHEGEDDVEGNGDGKVRNAGA